MNYLNHLSKAQKMLNSICFGLIIVLYVINSFMSSLRWGWPFNLGSALNGGIIFSLAIFLSLLPLFHSLIEIKKKNITGVFKLIFTPLFWSILIPASAITFGYGTQNGYLVAFAMIFLMVDFFFYVVNEVLLLINRKDE